jgi:hypothetical protein
MYGLNALPADPLRMRRLPFDSTMGHYFASELLAGLHLTAINKRVAN